jgi:hypothetical protein
MIALAKVTINTAKAMATIASSMTPNHFIRLLPSAALTYKGFDLAFRMQYQIVSFPKNKSEEQLGM